MDGFPPALCTSGKLNMDRKSPGSTEFLDQWLKNYEVSYDHIGKIQAAGPLREKTENMMKGFPLFYNLYSVWIDTIADFQNLSLEAMKKMNDKTANMDQINPDRNKELYNIFIETYSDTFKEFLRTEHFARDMGKFTSGLIEVQKYNREMLEENFLKPMDMPTRTEMEEMGKELYSLKKKVRELTQKMNELSR